VDDPVGDVWVLFEKNDPLVLWRRNSVNGGCFWLQHFDLWV
jgi:hypothetical protein